MPLKQLIVGWNRGGLGYIHQLLNKSGLDVGLTFGPGINLDEMLEKLPQAHTYEVSPYVVPFLGHEQLQGVKVIFVFRDPMRVFNSLYFHGLFHNEKNSAVQQVAFTYLNNFKDRYQGRPAQAICSYLHNWFRLACDYRKDITLIRVESEPQELLTGITGTPFARLPFLPPDVNASNCKQTVVPSKLPEAAQRSMHGLLVKLGYKGNVWWPRGGHAHYVNADWHC